MKIWIVEVIAASAGNHGQGVGLAAKIAKTKVTVYVPKDAANIKVEKMIAQGAEVIRVPGQFGDAEAKAIQESKTQNKVFVSPYNDPLIMAGAGTIGLELTEQCPTADTMGDTGWRRRIDRGDDRRRAEKS